MRPGDGYTGDDRTGDDMPRRVTDDMAEQVLSGRVPDGEWSALALALEALRHRSLVPPLDDDGRASLIAATALEAAAAAPTAGPSAVPRMRLAVPRLAARFAGATLVFFTLATGAAAAGILPHPVQTFVAAAGRVVGVDFPDPAATTTTTLPAEPDADPTMVPVMPDSTTTTTTAITVPVVAAPPPAPVIEVVLTSRVAEIPEPRGWVTFTVAVKNRSSQRVTIRDVTHDTFGDLLRPDGGRIRASTCGSEEARVEGRGRFTCTFKARLEGHGGSDHRAQVRVSVVDGWNRSTAAVGEATVAFTDVLPSVAVAATTGVAAIDEPGGIVAVTLTLTNTSVEPVTVLSLEDPELGSLLDAANHRLVWSDCHLLPATLQRGETVTCGFQAAMLGDAADGPITIAATLVVEDRQGNRAAAVGGASIAVNDVLPTVAITASSPVVAVTASFPLAPFTLTVTNHSVEAVTLDLLASLALGDLFSRENPSIVESTCVDAPRQIAAGGSMSCTLVASLLPNAGSGAFRSTIGVVARDNEGNPASASAPVAVAFVPESTRIGGTVFRDEDGNGTRDPDEPGLPGVRVIVTVPAFGEFVAVTGDGGDWSALVPVFEVAFAIDPSSVPVGMTATGGPGSGTVTPVAGTITRVPAIGYRYLPQRMSGRVVVDVDGDRTPGTADPGVPGVLVTLTDGAGKVVATATTDAAGAFAFVGNAAGSYTVSLGLATVPAGLAPSYEVDGSADGAVTVTVAAHEQRGGIDFGLRGSETIMGEDAPPNGRVVLTWFGFDGVPDTGDEITRVTSADWVGRYIFRYLPAGPFVVVFK